MQLKTNIIIMIVNVPCFKVKTVFSNDYAMIIKNTLPMKNMNNNINFPLFFTITTVISLIIDVSQFFILCKIVAPFLLTLYCALLTKNDNRGRLICIAILLCLESFCFYNYLLLPLLYLIPVALFGLYCKRNLYPSAAHGIIFALLCIT